LVDYDLAPAISAYLDGDATAADRLAEILTRHAAITVQAFLGAECPEADDIVQDTVVAVLAYLIRKQGFTGDLVNFTIAVARNRCRNLLIWQKRHPGVSIESLTVYLADPALGPLDTLLAAEVHDLLQEALQRLGADCRSLLQALFVEGLSVEEVRRRTGLKSVQGIYYRRAECLRQVSRLLKKRFAPCSSFQSGKKRGTEPTTRSQR
jgi:RNA polymerase sigma factor (sigma-70 family)